MYGEEKTKQIASAHFADPEYVAKHYRYREGDFWLGRNPVNHEQAIGYSDDRHVFLCAGTRTNKGRSIIINNLINWPGSVVSIDPKGENATISAERRANGRAGVCEGLGQKTYVLDPYGCAQVPDELRAYFNPLDALDPNDGDLMIKAYNLGEAISVINHGSESADWTEDAIDFIASVIAHVVTSEYINPEARNLITVRQLVIEGNVEGEEILRGAGKEVDAETILLKDMVNNPACRGRISAKGRHWLNVQRAPKQWIGMKAEAVKQLMFIDSDSMEEVLAPSTSLSRSPNLADLNDSETGISIFLCLPEDKYEPCKRWQRAMIETILSVLRQKQGLPVNGHQVLISLDEFLSLGKMDKIGAGMNSIAGAGGKLFISVTNIGDMKEIYKEGWEKFIAGCGLKIFFGADGETTKKYIEKDLGETEVRIVVNTHGEGESDTHTLGTSRSHAVGHSSNKSTAKGSKWDITDTENRSHTWNKNTSSSFGSNWQGGIAFNKSRQEGRARGSQQTKNFGPWWFFPEYQGRSEGQNTSYNSGTQQGISRTRGHGGQESTSTGSGVGGSEGSGRSTGRGGTNTVTESTGRTETLTHTSNESHAKGRSQNRSQAEQYHKKPLLSVDEIDKLLASPKERDHPAYPGMALIRISGEAPFIVRKSNYDQDPEFVGKFCPNPAYTFVPYDEKPLLGFEFNEEHLLPHRLPETLLEEGYIARPLVESRDWFAKGDPLYEVIAPDGETRIVEALLPGRVLDIADRESQEENGAIMITRGEHKYTPDALSFIEDRNFGEDIEQIEKTRGWRQLAIEAEKNQEERQRAEKEAREKRKYQDALEKDRWLSQRLYGFAWLGLLAVFVFSIVGYAVHVGVWPDLIDYDNKRVTQTFSGWNVSSGECDPTRPREWNYGLLGWKSVTCQVETDKVLFTHPVSGVGLGFTAFFRAVFFGIPIMLALMIFNRLAAKMDEHRELGAQFEQVSETFLGVIQSIWQTKWARYSLLVLLITSMIFYEMRVYPVYGDVRP